MYRSVKRFSHRIPFLQREKSAYITLRRKGLSINQLSKAFGRSTSVIHRIISKQFYYENLRKYDLRKLPTRIKRSSASFRWKLMMKLRSAWEAWISGEGDRPP